MGTLDSKGCKYTTESGVFRVMNGKNLYLLLVSTTNAVAMSLSEDSRSIYYPVMAYAFRAYEQERYDSIKTRFALRSENWKVKLL